MQIIYFENEKQEKAFWLGLAFYLGIISYKNRKFVFDEEFENPDFITVNHQPVAIDPETHQINGLGITEVPHELPNIENYLKSVESEKKSFTAKVKQYLFENYRNKRISEGSGIPTGYSVYFDRVGLEKSVENINSSNVWALQYIADVYRKGKVIANAPDKKKHKNVKRFFYSTLTVTHNGQLYRLKVDATEKYDHVLEIQHYMLSKIQKVKK